MAFVRENPKIFFLGIDQHFLPWLLKACFLDYQRVPHLHKFPYWKSKVPAVTFEEEKEGNLSSMPAEAKQEVHIDLHLVVFDQADEDRTNSNSGNARGCHGGGGTHFKLVEGYESCFCTPTENFDSWNGNPATLKENSIYLGMAC